MRTAYVGADLYLR